MPAPSDAVTVTLPRSAVEDVLNLSATRTERLHELLERNTDGTLSPVEREELETLVRMTQFGQVMALAFQAPGQP